MGLANLGQCPGEKCQTNMVQGQDDAKPEPRTAQYITCSACATAQEMQNIHASEESSKAVGGGKDHGAP